MSQIERPEIPAPPDADAPPEVLSAYYEQYSPQELLDAGHMQVLSKNDPRVLRRNVAAAEIRGKRKRAQLNIVFTESELSELSAYAQAVHIPVSTIAKSWVLRVLKIEKSRLSETGI